MTADAPHEYRVSEHTEAYRGPIFTVFSDQVEMPGGGRQQRDYVHHLGSVATVAIDDDDQVVLIWQYRHAVRGRVWELPAGLADVPGEAALATAQRELAEETGLRARHWATLLDIRVTPGYSDELGTIFLARGLEPQPGAGDAGVAGAGAAGAGSGAAGSGAAGDEETEIEVRRFPLDTALRMIRAGEIVNATAVVGILAAHQFGRDDHPGR